jgi:hypothetical protein
MDMLAAVMADQLFAHRSEEKSKKLDVSKAMGSAP